MKDFGKKTILVVDDAATSRAILRRVFQEQYEVLEAANGREALDLLAQRPDIAVVVLDIVMPELDGFSVLSAMRSSETLRGIPVIVMTASSDEETQMRALERGAMDVLSKPINPRVTQMRVENLIARIDAARLSERNQAMERDLKEADTDEISGLYNKNAFLRRAAQHLREHRDRQYVLLRWDIDNFKVYNDIYGVKAGDEFLRSVGDYILMHSGDFPGLVLFARYEADHFVGLIDGESFSAEACAEAIMAAMRREKELPFDYCPRVGLYLIEDSSIDVTLMCDRALLALKSIKNTYSAHYVWFESSMRESLMREHEIVNQMKSALDSGQFHVFFQPQYNYTSGTLTGAEALVRWIHPEKGIISPAEFIPIFEKNGFIFELDSYVWETTCAYMRRWKAIGLQNPPITVSVNISRKDLYQPDIVERISSLPKEYGIAPADLHLEITESAYIENPEQVVSVVSQLREQGFSVEMDDFGSGYSSLNTLKNVPVDVLKLDMKFLSSDSDNDKGGRILSSIIRMAHEIELPVIAEGVETLEQAEFLKSIGCHYMQGFYFSRPVPVEELEKLLSNRSISSVITPSVHIGVDGAADFMNANTQTTLLFNSFVGGAAIVEYNSGNVAMLRINDRFFESLGLDRQSYSEYQYNLLRRFDDGNRGKLIAALDEAIATGGESECEIASLPAEGLSDGIWTHCRFRCLTRRVESYILYMSVENITQRKRMKQALAQTTDSLSRQLEYHSLINHFAPGLIAVRYHGEGEKVYLVGRLSESLGYSDEEMQSYFDGDLSELGYEEDAEYLKSAVADIYERQPVTYQTECRIRKRDGGFLWVMGRGARFVGQHGKSGYIHIFTDITKRRMLLDELRKNELIMNCVAAQTDRIFYHYDTRACDLAAIDAEKSRVNGLSKRFFNPTESMLRSGFVYPDSADSLQKLFNLADSGLASYDLRIHVRDENSREKWFDCRCSPIIKRGEFLHAAVISLLDITEQHEREVIYARYCQTIDAGHADKLMFFETDLTTNTVVKAGGKLLPSSLHFEGRANDEVVQELLMYGVRAEGERAAASQACARERLLTLYTDGVRELEHEVPVSHREHAGIHWLRISMQLVEDPFTGHIRIFTQLQDITAEKERLITVQRRAELDGMTGLYNHATTEQIVNELLRDAAVRPCAFLLLDIDDLKQINDTHGHPQGDRAIISLARTLKKHFRHSDIIGRVGGDEFVVLLPGISDREQLTSTVKKLLDELADSSEFGLHCSIGCTFCRSSQDSFASVYERADKALYSIKRSSKNSFAISEE